MMSCRSQPRQSGMAMVIVMVMMIAITLFGIAVMNMGALEQRMAGNYQLLAESFEVSEAGLRGAIALSAGTANPFNARTMVEDPAQTAANAVNPFASVDPLSSIHGEAGLDVDLHLVGVGFDCPRSSAPTSSTLIDCDYYRLDSQHKVTNTGVKTGVALHVIEQVPEGN